jgi:RNA polymerase sigma factor (sigma-70 family)
VTASQTMGAALPEVYERLRQPLRRLLYAYRIPPEDAEDVVQGALVLAVQKWSAIRDPEAWLLGTVKKRCILYWRARRQYEERYEPLGEEWQGRQAAASPEERRDLLRDVARACRRELPAGQRKLLALRFQMGLSPREAGAAIGLAYSSVRKTTNRAIGRLRQAIGRDQSGGAGGGPTAVAPSVSPAPARLRPQEVAAGVLLATAGAFVLLFVSRFGTELAAMREALAGPNTEGDSPGHRHREQPAA